MRTPTTKFHRSLPFHIFRPWLNYLRSQKMASNSCVLKSNVLVYQISSPAEEVQMTGPRLGGRSFGGQVHLIFCLNKVQAAEEDPWTSLTGGRTVKGS